MKLSYIFELCYLKLLLCCHQQRLQKQNILRNRNKTEFLRKSFLNETKKNRELCVVRTQTNFLIQFKAKESVFRLCLPKKVIKFTTKL